MIFAHRFPKRGLLLACLLLAGCTGFEGSVSSYVGETAGSEFYGGMVRVEQPLAPRWSLFGQTEILRYPDEWWTQTYGGVTYSFGGGTPAVNPRTEGCIK